MFQRTVLSHMGATPLPDWNVPGLELHGIPTPRWEAYCVGGLVGRGGLVLSQGLLACLGQEELAELAKTAVALSQTRRQKWLTVVAAVSLWLRALLPKPLSDAFLEGRGQLGSATASAGFWSVLRALMIWPYLMCLDALRGKARARGPADDTALGLEMESLRIERNLGAHLCQDLRPLSLLRMNSNREMGEFK